MGSANIVTGAGVIQSTTDPLTKPVPFRVRVTPGGLHAGVVEDDKELMTGVAIVKGTREEAVVPGLTSWMFVDPGDARSEAGTVATRPAGTAAMAGT